MIIFQARSTWISRFRFTRTMKSMHSVLKENVKTTSALLGLSYRSFIKWKVPSVH